MALFPRRTCCIYPDICHNVLWVTCHWWYSSFLLVHRMAHWFHRNPLKATAPVSFNYYGVAGSPAANKICKYVTSPLPVQIPLWPTTSALFMFPIATYSLDVSLLHAVALSDHTHSWQSRRQSLWEDLASFAFICPQFTRFVRLRNPVICGQRGRGCWRCSPMSPATLRWWKMLQMHICPYCKVW